MMRASLNSVPPTRVFRTRLPGVALAALTLFVLAVPTKAREVDGRIRLDTVGYPPAYPKRASVAARFEEFRVVRETDGAVVFTGRASAPRRNEDTGEEIYVADFSALAETGTYSLDVAGVGRSATFLVAPEVYEEPFRVAFRAMFLWRCGQGVSSATRGGPAYRHDACHLEDARLDFVGRPGGRRDATGGWHDAGDYNKYVVNAGVTVGILLRAWEDERARIERVTLTVPNADERLPNFLSEIKWETDWLLKMQAADGSVYHKVSTKEFGPAVMPEEEKTERYFAPWSSAATADFAAVLAQAARVFREKFDVDWGWSNVKNLGMITYLASRRRGRDGGLVRELRAALLETADRIVALRDAHGYARPLGTKYYWGANGGVANTVVLLQAARRVSPKRAYAETALDALHNLFGRNPYGRSFVTGLGHDPPRRPHDRRSMGRAHPEAWPGYLVGGGWPKATDWADDEQNYRVNEIAINWNAPLVYALAAFVEEPPLARRRTLR